MTQTASYFLNAQARLKRSRQYAKLFEWTFGVPIDTYFSMYTGLDICKLDIEIVKSGDEAMRDVILRKYGQEVMTMIEELL